MQIVLEQVPSLKIKHAQTTVVNQVEREKRKQQIRAAADEAF